MSIVNGEGILLRSHPYSESSRIMRFLTPGYGVLSVVARGVRRDSSRGKRGAETFDDASLVFTYRESRDLHTLRDLQVTRSRRGLARELARFTGASLLAELVLAHTLQEENPALFEGVRWTLDRLEAAPADEVAGAILAGCWTLLAEGGFPPTLDACAACGRGLPESGLLRFDAGRGGLLCARCGEGGSGTRLGPGARGDLTRMVRGEAPAGLRGARVHLELLESFAHHRLETRRGFRAVALLRPLFEGPASEGTAPEPASTSR